MQQLQRQTKPQTAIWSIDIFAGRALNDLAPASQSGVPVLSALDVTDIPASFVADPFMVRVQNTWFMFFEVLNAKTNRGEIGLATSADALDWKYQQIVLREPFHLSYPHVFCLDGEFFMIPESYEANEVRLYRAESFPLRWRLVETMLEGRWVDSSLFAFDGQWWLFSNPVAPAHQVLELFYAQSIHGPWSRHPLSPLIQGNNRLARCAGRAIVAAGRPVRFAQDCFPDYGSAVRAFEVTRLTTTNYEERELEGSPILSAGAQHWRKCGMHHVDPHFENGAWLACVDGWVGEVK